MNYNNMLIYFFTFIILWSIPASNGHDTSPPSSSKAAINDLNDHARFLVSEICSLHQKERFSDVILVVNEERIPAHRYILALSSEYFSKLFYESDDDDKKTYKSDVKINVGPANLFKKLLKFMYTGEALPRIPENKDIFELLKIAEYYGVSNLKSKLHIYLQSNIDYSNVFTFFAIARLYKFEALEDKTLNYIEDNFSLVTKSGDFLNVPTGDLLEIINRDTFYVEEICIFRAVCLWISVNEHQLDYSTKLKILSAVRYPVMSDKELSEVRESQQVSPDIILKAIQIRTSLSDKPQFRGHLIPDESLYNIKYYYNKGANMFKLDKPSTINYFEMALYTEAGKMLDVLKSYSYYIEVSTNGQHWTRVIDYSNFHCRARQQLWIHPQVVWYVKVTGTNNSADEIFDFWNIKYDTINMHNIEIHNGFIVPKGTYNVASNTKYAIVINGENSVFDKSLLYNLNDYQNRFDMYTYHLVRPKTDSIVIHLAQPYMLSSMRLLLWGLGDQTYSYFIEASLDRRRWVEIVDRSHKMAQSWQDLHFEPRLILYIRITGVSNSVGNDFRCVYLEAPSQVT